MGKRIGEILLEHDWVEPQLLERALAKQHELARQHEHPRRLCSLLIDAGLLTLDEASRALGAQHGVLAALQKHLDGRDLALASRLPAALARSLVALPLGRMATGAVIVCVRDPAPAIAATLSRAMQEQVVLAVAPAQPLEALVRASYPAEAEEPDVALGDGPRPTLELELEPGEAPSGRGPRADPSSDPRAELAEDLSEELAEAPGDAGDPLAGFGALQLVGLDDVGVSKRPMPSQQVPATTRPARTDARPSAAARPTRSSLPPATSARPTRSSLPPATTPRPVESGLSVIATPRTITPPPSTAASPPEPSARASNPAIAVGTEPPTRQFLELPVTLDETLATLARGLAPDAAADAAIAFAATRWAASLLLAIEDGVAIGYRGHGSQLPAQAIEAIAIPVSAPSLVQAAHDAAALATAPPPEAGAVEERLERLLGLPRSPAAIAITCEGRVAYVLVVGDPRTGGADAATAELRLIAGALGRAFARAAAP